MYQVHAFVVFINNYIASSGKNYVNALFWPFLSHHAAHLLEEEGLCPTTQLQLQRLLDI